MEIDLVGFFMLTAIRCKDPDEVSRFTSFNMEGAPKTLRIPHMTQVDGNHFVIGKVPNQRGAPPWRGTDRLYQAGRTSRFQKPPVPGSG